MKYLTTYIKPPVNAAAKHIPNVIEKRLESANIGNFTEKLINKPIPNVASNLLENDFKLKCFMVYNNKEYKQQQKLPLKLSLNNNC